VGFAAAGTTTGLVFVGALIAGMMLYHWTSRRRAVARS
jgi:hypothetical protein